MPPPKSAPPRSAYRTSAARMTPPRSSAGSRLRPRGPAASAEGVAGAAIWRQSRRSPYGAEEHVDAGEHDERHARPATGVTDAAVA